MTLLVWIEYQQPSLSGVDIEIGSSRRPFQCRGVAQNNNPFIEVYYRDSLLLSSWECVKVAAMSLFFCCHLSRTRSLLTLSPLLSLNKYYLYRHECHITRDTYISQITIHVARIARYAVYHTVTVSLPDLFLDKTEDFRVVGQLHFCSRDSSSRGAFKSTVSV